MTETFPYQAKFLYMLAQASSRHFGGLGRMHKVAANCISFQMNVANEMHVAIEMHDQIKCPSLTGCMK